LESAWVLHLRLWRLVLVTCCIRLLLLLQWAWRCVVDARDATIPMTSEGGARIHAVLGKEKAAAGEGGK
jgi:hypothetical protein